MRAKMTKLVSLLVVSLIIVSAFAGCSKKDDDSIVIGVLLPTSGSEAEYGNDMLRSYQFAVDEINEAGGILGRKVTLYQADDGCDADMASSAASKIVSKNIDFVVGGYCSGATVPAMQQFYEENMLFLISGANSTKITEAGFNQTFMLNGTSVHASSTLAELCLSLDVKKVALVHQGEDYSKDLSDVCEKALPQSGIEIATIQLFPKGNTDAASISTAIRNSGADFVYWCGYHADGSVVIKQLRNDGYPGYIAVGDGSSSVELISFCGEAGEGLYVTSPPFVKFTLGGEEFFDAYSEKYGMEPGTYATLCYDTMYVLKEAIEKAGSTDFEAVRENVQNAEYQGLSGFIQFTENRELATSNFIVLKVENGEFKLVTLE